MDWLLKIQIFEQEIDQLTKQSIFLSLPSLKTVSAVTPVNSCVLRVARCDGWASRVNGMRCFITSAMRGNALVNEKSKSNSCYRKIWMKMNSLFTETSLKQKRQRLGLFHHFSLIPLICLHRIHTARFLNVWRVAMWFAANMLVTERCDMIWFAVNTWRGACDEGKCSGGVLTENCTTSECKPLRNNWWISGTVRPSNICCQSIKFLVLIESFRPSWNHLPEDKKPNEFSAVVPTLVSWHKHDRT